MDELRKLEKNLRSRHLISGSLTGEELYRCGSFTPFETELIAKRLYDFAWDHLPPIPLEKLIYSETALEIGTSPRKFFLPRNLVNYSYISESGTPMVGCILHLETPKHVIQLAKDFVNALGFPRKISSVNAKKAAESLERYVDETNKICYDSRYKIKDKLHDLKFLGSSAKPVLTKARAIEEFRRGLSTDEVRQKYRHVNGKPLAAWKAHVTMGNYDEKPFVETDEVVVDEEDYDLEKITEDEAKGLISSGIPVEEILQAYPTSFSIHQLRAYEHWIKRKLGEENGNS